MKTTDFKLWLLFGLLASVLVSCGVKAPPIPAEPDTPQQSDLVRPSPSPAK